MGGAWPSVHDESRNLRTPVRADRVADTPRGWKYPRRELAKGVKPAVLRAWAITLKRICRTISAIGKKANVVVNKASAKFASAHDLRRSFATRWASRVKPATLQLLMRHKPIETTLKDYVDQDADDVADELWRSQAAFG